MNKKVRLSNGEHPASTTPCVSKSSSDTRKHVEKYRLSNEFLCDRTVEFMESGDTRNIVAVELAEQSMYFERLVRYHKGRGVIQLPEFLRPGFDSVIEFIRKGSVNITEENAYDIFIASDYLLVTSLKELCCSFIQSMASNAKTAILLWVTCRNLHWPELGKMAYEKILENFENVGKIEEFQNLDVRDVREIIVNDRLNCKTEMAVLDCIQFWVSVNLGVRKFHCYDLLKCVRLGLLKPDDFQKLKSNELIKSVPQFSQIIDSWPDSVNEKTMLSSTCALRMITPRFPHDAIFVFGGWCDGQGPRAATQVYDPRADRWALWTQESPTTNLIGGIPCRVYAGCVLVGFKVFLVGGFDGHSALKSTLCYDFEIESGWYEISCMYECRYYVSVAHCGSNIYAIGGHNGEREPRRLDSAERYHLSENLWEPIARMNRVRSDASAASLGNKVYVCGGFEGRRYHDSAEAYDPDENQWTLVARMHSPRGGVSLVRQGTYIYAIGGNDGHSRLRTIERFNPESAHWEVVGSMQRRKSNLSSTVIDDDIYIIGGWSDEQDQGILNSVEKFNVNTRTCSLVNPLLFAASATCSCTVNSQKIITKFINRDQRVVYLLDYGAINNCGGSPSSVD